MAKDKKVKSQIKALQEELAQLQQQIKEANIPVIILIDGWSASGKGRMISSINSRLEPRGYKVFSSKAATGDQLRKPSLWRYWMDIPSKGFIGIFERGWYYDGFQNLNIHMDNQKQVAYDINTFERQLIEDGYHLIKFFLDVDKDEQLARMEALQERKSTSWRITDKDTQQNRNFSHNKDIRNKLLSITSMSCPWHVVDNNDPEQGTLKLLTDLVNSLKDRLKLEEPIKISHKAHDFKLLPMAKLSDIPLDKSLTEAQYKKAMKKEKEKLRNLHSLLYREKVPVVLVFEGWDAAGKGGGIRRLSWSLDPRGFEALSVAAPTPQEKSKHYLWRFWNSLPKDGHIAIFDRSWYGRVMVERIEKFTPKDRWSMAYEEINEFEKSLTDWGAIVLKFWVHIDSDTQLERFTQRMENPEKQYKITDEDWRNREKWPEYEKAIDEMISKTSTEKAPWIIVEGNDKSYARIKIMKEVRKALEKKLR